jgi:hypothetical protein
MPVTKKKKKRAYKKAVAARKLPVKKRAKRSLRGA